jgi:menaquinone-dependent protoporphyrinogen oxidase
MELPMPRVLVIYGTTDGHTAKVSQAIEATLRGAGIDVDVIDASINTRSPEHYAGVVVAASVHGGQFQPATRRWVRAHAHTLRGRPTAFVAVCLAVLHSEDPKVQRDLAAVLERFYTTTGWRPTVSKTVAGALLYTRYNWLMRQIMKRIVRKAGGDTDTSRDYEYTDWADLRRFVEQFALRLPDAKAPSPVRRVA